MDHKQRLEDAFNHERMDLQRFALDASIEADKVNDPKFPPVPGRNAL
jgi:hypothetical protein